MLVIQYILPGLPFGVGYVLGYNRGYFNGNRKGRLDGMFEAGQAIINSHQKRKK